MCQTKMLVLLMIICIPRSLTSVLLQEVRDKRAEGQGEMLYLDLLGLIWLT